jgi:hypothetical protein
LKRDVLEGDRAAAAERLVKRVARKRIREKDAESAASAVPREVTAQ